MKKFSSKSVFSLMFSASFAIVAGFFFAPHAFAMTPSLSLVSNNNGTVSVTVSGDPNSSVILDYYSGGQLIGAGILGYTNDNGYFSTTINQNSYTYIPTNAQVVVLVNSQQSGVATWPTSSYYNPGYVLNTPVTL